MASSVAVLQACSAVTTSTRSGSSGEVNRILDRAGEEAHARKAKPGGQFAGFLDQFRAAFDADDFAAGTFLDTEIVEDEAEIGLAGPVVDQRFGAIQQRLDELVEVIDLLELAPGVLVELAVAGQDVQFLEQFDGLPGTDFRDRSGLALLFHRARLSHSNFYDFRVNRIEIASLLGTW